MLWFIGGVLLLLLLLFPLNDHSWCSHFISNLSYFLLLLLLLLLSLLKVTTSVNIADPTGRHRSTDNIANSEPFVSPAVEADRITTTAVANDDVPALPPPPTLPVDSSTTAVTVVYVPYPGDCCPKTCHCKYWCWDKFLRTSLGDKWWTYRCYCKRLVDHRYFESFIIFMIMTSSISLVNTLRWNINWLKQLNDIALLNKSVRLRATGRHL